MPAMSRSFELTPSAATSSRASQRRAVGEMHGHAGAVAVEAARPATPSMMSMPSSAARRRSAPFSVLVGDHVGEGLARRDLAVEGEEHRPHRIGGARIGDDHLGDRLRLRRDLVPAAELVEHAAGGGGDRRGAAVLLPDAGRRGVDDGDREARAAPRLSDTAAARPT